MGIIEERNYKFGKVKDEYDKRKTQEEVAKKFNMSIRDVAKVTRGANNWHTRNITPENKRTGEKIDLFTNLNNFSFLDKYPRRKF